MRSLIFSNGKPPLDFPAMAGKLRVYTHIGERIHKESGYSWRTVLSCVKQRTGEKESRNELDGRKKKRDEMTRQSRSGRSVNEDEEGLTERERERNETEKKEGRKKDA